MTLLNNYYMETWNPRFQMAEPSLPVLAAGWHYMQRGYIQRHVFDFLTAYYHLKPLHLTLHVLFLHISSENSGLQSF